MSKRAAHTSADDGAVIPICRPIIYSDISDDVKSLYRFEECIYRADDSEVWKAVSMQSGALVAVKRLIKAEGTLEKSKREIETLKNLYHQNILLFIDHFEDAESYYIVTEYLSGATGRELVRDYEDSGSVMPEFWVGRIFRQVVSGIYYMHRYNIVHRDMKPCNIVFAKGSAANIRERIGHLALLGGAQNGHRYDWKSIRIIDMGSAACAHQRVTASTGFQGVVGSPWFAAPEVCAGGEYGLACDIWSLGCILLDLLTGQKVPVEDGGDGLQLRQMDLSSVIIEGKEDATRKPGNPRELSPLLHSLLTNLLNTDPDDRPSASDILVHPWILRHTASPLFMAKCIVPPKRFPTVLSCGSSIKDASYSQLIENMTGQQAPSQCFTSAGRPIFDELLTVSEMEEWPLDVVSQEAEGEKKLETLNSSTSLMAKFRSMEAISAVTDLPYKSWYIILASLANSFHRNSGLQKEMDHIKLNCVPVRDRSILDAKVSNSLFALDGTESVENQVNQMAQAVTSSFCCIVVDVIAPRWSAYTRLNAVQRALRTQFSHLLNVRLLVIPKMYKERLDGLCAFWQEFLGHWDLEGRCILTRSSIKYFILVMKLYARDKDKVTSASALGHSVSARSLCRYDEECCTEDRSSSRATSCSSIRTSSTDSVMMGCSDPTKDDKICKIADNLFSGPTYPTAHRSETTEDFSVGSVSKVPFGSLHSSRADLTDYGNVVPPQISTWTLPPALKLMMSGLNLKERSSVREDSEEEVKKLSKAVSISSFDGRTDVRMLEERLDADGSDLLHPYTHADLAEVEERMLADFQAVDVQCNGYISANDFITIMLPDELFLDESIESQVFDALRGQSANLTENQLRKTFGWVQGADFYPRIAALKGRVQLSHAGSYELMVMSLLTSMLNQRSEWTRSEFGKVFRGLTLGDKKVVGP